MDVLLFYSVVALGPGLAGGASAFLTFTRFRYTWIVLVCALPPLGVGAFYTVTAIVIDREVLPFDIPLVFLLFLGLLSIVRWCYKRP